jgi:Uma2 family endonuclease
MTGRVETAGYEYMDLDNFEELLADKPAHEKWELIGGRVVRMMVGARWEHNFIVQNVAHGLRERLRAAGSSCRTLAETFYLKDETLEAAVLPDVIVQCGPLPPGATSLRTPTVIVEVLSIGSEARDRLSKWQIYQRVESLQHYALVSQDHAHVETFHRVDGAWSGLRIEEGLEATLRFDAISVDLPLAEIYRDVLSA